MCFILQEYGGLEYCPDEITATVLEMEQLTMSEVNILVQYIVGIFICVILRRNCVGVTSLLATSPLPVNWLCVN